MYLGLVMQVIAFLEQNSPYIEEKHLKRIPTEDYLISGNPFRNPKILYQFRDDAVGYEKASLCK